MEKKFEHPAYLCVLSESHLNQFAYFSRRC